MSGMDWIPVPFSALHKGSGTCREARSSSKASGPSMPFWCVGSAMLKKITSERLLGQTRAENGCGSRVENKRESSAPQLSGAKAHEKVVYLGRAGCKAEESWASLEKPQPSKTLFQLCALRRALTHALRLQKGSCGNSETWAAMPSSMPHAVRLVRSAVPSSDSACHLPHGPMHAKRAENSALTISGLLFCDAVLETEDEAELKLLARCSAARSTISASSSEGGL